MSIHGIGDCLVVSFWLHLGIALVANPSPAVQPRSTDAPAGDVAVPSHAQDVMWLEAESSALSAESRRATAAHVGDAAALTVDVVPAIEDRAGMLAVAKARLEARPARAALFVLWPTEDQAELYLYDPQGPDLWMRPVPRNGQSHVLWAESVGLIAAAAVRAMATSKPVGMSRVAWPTESPPDDRVDEAPPPRAAEVPSHPGEPWAGAVTLSAGYRGGPFAPSHRWTHGIDLGFGVAFPNGACFVLGYEVLFPLRAEREGNRVTLTRHPLRLGAGFRWRVTERLHVRPALLVAFDAIRRRSSTRNDQLRALPAATLVEVGIVPAIEVGVALTRHVYGFVELRPEVWLRPRPFGAATPDVVELLRPYGFRPTLQVGVGGALPSNPTRPRPSRKARVEKKLDG